MILKYLTFNDTIFGSTYGSALEHLQFYSNLKTVADTSIVGKNGGKVEKKRKKTEI